MNTISRKTYLIVAIVLVLLIIGYFIVNKNNPQTQLFKNSSSSSPTASIGEDNSVKRFYSRVDDANYIYQFDSSSHKLSRLNRSGLAIVGTPADFFYVEDIGPTDAKGNTFIIGAKTDQNISQNYLCNFSTECRPIDANISQVILTPDNETMVIKFQDEKYQLGYFDAATNKLTAVYTLDSPYYRVSFIDNNQVVLYAGTGSTDPGPISILNLNSKIITRTIDEALYFSSSVDGKYIIYSKSENDASSSYVYDTTSNTKIKLAGKNFYGFFFDQNDKLYEISTENQAKLIYHDLSSGSDKANEIKELNISNTKPITEIIWLTSSAYLITFSDGKTQQIDI